MGKENIIEIIKKSKSRNDALIKIYGYANKLSYNKLNIFIGDNNININHWDKKINYCVFCDKLILRNTKKFCNSSCAAKHNNKNRKLSNKTKNNIGNSLLLWHKNNHSNSSITKYFNCVVCGKKFERKRIENARRFSRAKTCSEKCKKEQQILNGKKNAFQRIENGNHRGWATRNIVSYPEQFFIEVLNNNNIKFQHNYPVNKRDLGLNDSCNYFLDFYIEDKNIDLEIDGKQHKYRKEHDDFRDTILKKNNYVVYRIKWKNINTEKGKLYIKNEIDKFLLFYNIN